MDPGPALEITVALYELCQQNNRPFSEKDEEFYSIDNCLSSLKDNNVFQARAYYNQVSLGGMGCFNDWHPKYTYQNPINKYHGNNFQNIVKEWSKIMCRIGV